MYSDHAKYNLLLPPLPGSLFHLVALESLTTAGAFALFEHCRQSITSVEAMVRTDCELTSHT